MTSAYITGGSVEFTRPSNYSADKSGAKVELTFACAEGTPDEVARAMLDTVAAMAKAKAHEMVGDAAPRAAAPLRAGVADPLLTATASLVPSPPLPPPAEFVIETIPTGSVVTEVRPNGIVYEPPAADLPAAITDSDLVAAITQANARLLNRATNDIERQQVPGRLRDVVAKYVAPPGRVQSIPPAQRAAAIADLNSL